MYDPYNGILTIDSYADDEITCESLIDVLQSQICLYGNKAIFSPEKSEDESFSISVEGKDVLDCVLEANTCKDKFGLVQLVERLSKFESDGLITHNRKESSGDFKVGFMSDEGFVEVLSSSEIVSMEKSNTLGYAWAV